MWCACLVLLWEVYVVEHLLSWTGGRITFISTWRGNGGEQGKKDFLPAPLSVHSQLCRAQDCMKAAKLSLHNIFALVPWHSLCATQGSAATAWMFVIFLPVFPNYSEIMLLCSQSRKRERACLSTFFSSVHTFLTSLPEGKEREDVGAQQPALPTQIDICHTPACSAGAGFISEMAFFLPPLWQ